MKQKMPQRYGSDQQEMDSLHRAMVDGRLSREDYVKQINLSWNLLEPSLLPDLQRRKDRRSLGEFALQVHDCTIRENFLLSEWIKTLGREDIRIENFGLANDGRLILDTKTDRTSGRPDYLITSMRGSWKLEVKFNPVWHKQTFKVCDIKNYLKHDALVLLVMGATQMIGPNGDYSSDNVLKVPKGLKWCVFGRETLQTFLHKFPIKPHWEVGNKPSIQLQAKDVNRLLSIQEWKYQNKNK